MCVRTAPPDGTPAAMQEVIPWYVSLFTKNCLRLNQALGISSNKVTENVKNCTYLCLWSSEGHWKQCAIKQVVVTSGSAGDMLETCNSRCFVASWKTSPRWDTVTRLVFYLSKIPPHSVRSTSWFQLKRSHFFFRPWPHDKEAFQDMWWIRYYTFGFWLNLEYAT